MTTKGNSSLVEIGKASGELIKRADDRRLSFSNLAITVYSVVTSGLVALATTLELGSVGERIGFITVTVSAALIVFFALLERYAYFLSSDAMSKKYVDYVKKNKEPFYGQLAGEKWHSYVIRFCTHAIMLAFLVNIIAVIVFVSISVYN